MGPILEHASNSAGRGDGRRKAAWTAPTPDLESLPSDAAVNNTTRWAGLKS